ncbi:glycosyltransferase family 2 protein [Pseudomonas lactis]|uniref:glycosyltransferase family 2 protein n=1 Tax=Pseudomonas lactis TaxID=1615674 RepID=UPI000AF781EC|nr:glycosyltransferase family 2 protein [Pseudomonas lactis]
MNSPKSVSVIVPVFNASATLLPTLNSLLDQTLENLEIIVVDDASTDSSSEIIKKLTAENKKIISLCFSENKGVHEARLAGIRRASAPWIGFLDADDFARPDMFELMFNAATQKNVDITLCGSYRTNVQGKTIRKRTFFQKSERVDNKIFERFCRFEFGDGALWNKLYRSKLLKNLDFKSLPWRQNINEDLITNIGAFHKADSLYLMKDILHEYVENADSVTAKQNNSTAYINTFRAYALALRAYQHFDAESIFHITSMYRKQLDDSLYRVDDLKYLEEHYTAYLVEAIKEIEHIYPQGLGLLCCRSRDLSNLPIKLLARNLIKKIFTRIRMFSRRCS